MKLSGVVESLLFASHEPLSAKTIVKAIVAAKKEAEAKKEPEAKKEAEEAGAGEARDLGVVTELTVTAAIEELNSEYKKGGRAFRLSEGPVGWKVYTLQDYAGWVRQLFPAKNPARLSPPALETLAIIAYRQPVTKADIEAVRGVSVDGVLQTVMDRGLAHIAGRADLPGRPLLYETTEHFLEHFGIRSVEDLPNQSELRRANLPVAEVTGEAAQGREGDSAGGELPVETQLALAAVGDQAPPEADESGEGSGGDEGEK